MEQVNIDTVEKVGHCTLELRGYFRSSRFTARLEGVGLNILTPVPFSDDEKKELKEKIRDVFAEAMTLPGGGYDKRKVNKIMRDHDEVLLIRVGEDS